MTVLCPDPRWTCLNGLGHEGREEYTGWGFRWRTSRTGGASKRSVRMRLNDPDQMPWTVLKETGRVGDERGRRWEGRGRAQVVHSPFLTSTPNTKNNIWTSWTPCLLVFLSPNACCHTFQCASYLPFLLHIVYAVKLCCSWKGHFPGLREYLISVSWTLSIYIHTS